MSGHNNRRIGADILIPFILLALVFGGLFWQKYHEADKLPQNPPGTQGTATIQKIVLFFGDENGNLTREARDIETCQDRTTCLRSLLEELFRGPINNLTPVIPEWTVINEVKLEGPLAVVDLGKDFADALPSGSSAEMLAVYAIVDTICANMPEIKQVQITLDGNNQAHLRHLDLSDPLTPDFSLESPASAEQDQQSQKKTP